MEKRSLLLEPHQITQKTERIAYEIYENTFEDDIVYVGGIGGNGFLFAERLVNMLTTISPQQIRLFEVKINKDQPLSHDVELSVADSDLSGSTCVLVDDVINSGRTMMYAVRKLLDNDVRELKVATLVNRTHRRFPVHADYVGVNISNTVKDHIIVELGEEEGAFLE